MKTTDFTERFLYHIWDAGHLKPELYTISGRKIKIISPGRYSSSAGPDFREAVLALDDDLLRGDVEIHKTTYDWKAHGHSNDRNYCRVILHVVYQHNVNLDFTIDKNGRNIEIFAIQDFLDDDVSRIFSGYQDDPHLPKDKFCSFFAGQSAELLAPLLAKYGSFRLNEKTKRFAAEQYFTGFNQLAYQGILEALGYSKNKYQMLQLANSLTYTQLRSFAADGMTEQQLIALWLGCSGLIDKLPATFPAEFILKWKELYARQEFIKEQMEIDWHLFRIRPVNHPAIRLLQVSSLVFESLQGSLFNKFINLFSFPAGDIKMSDFYQRIYALFIRPGEFLPDKYKLGKTRLDTVFINIILPLALLYARENKFQEMETAVLYIYNNFHALPDNHITKSMRQFMDSAQIRLTRKKAVFQQAILYINDNFCRYHTCTSCQTFKSQTCSEMFGVHYP
ncbi:MAG: DUF2851 family protein [Candidatus Cloacimonetes bacterium]|nr:DUF2851 family protein [Candidatus Cloacimonadota bacterium]